MEKQKIGSQSSTIDFAKDEREESLLLADGLNVFDEIPHVSTSPKKP
jgi:hypothetical protein